MRLLEKNVHAQQKKKKKEAFHEPKKQSLKREVTELSCRQKCKTGYKKIRDGERHAAGFRNVLWARCALVKERALKTLPPAALSHHSCLTVIISHNADILNKTLEMQAAHCPHSKKEKKKRKQETTQTLSMCMCTQSPDNRTTQVLDFKGLQPGDQTTRWSPSKSSLRCTHPHAVHLHEVL